MDWKAAIPAGTARA